MREIKVTHIFIFSHFPNYKLWQKFHQNGHESRKVSSHVMFPSGFPLPLPLCRWSQAGRYARPVSEIIVSYTQYYLDNKILT